VVDRTRPFGDLALEEGLGAFQAVWDPADPPPAISVLVVSAFANPTFLVEISAIAVL
jgi:enamine deaminase RidA (YjgF/YER057c/UK114 family)